MANIIVQISVDEDLCVFTIEGPLTAEEILEYSAEYYMNNPTKYVLWDTRYCSVVGISSGELKDMAEKMLTLTAKRKGSKTAFVINGRSAYGMGSMYETFAIFEDLQIRYRVFRGIEDAKSWLLKS